MTVSTEVKRNDYIGGGPDLPFNFRVFDEADIRVVKAVVATGVESDLVLNTDFTVDGVGDADGTVTLIDATVAADLLAGDIVVSIIRDMELTQPTDIRNLGDFYPAVHEDEMDRLLMQIQQLMDSLERSLKLPLTEAGTEVATLIPGISARAGYVLGFDSLGNPTAVASVPTSPAITLASFFVSWLTTTLPGFMQTFLTATTAPLALAALGVSTFMQDFLTKTTAALARLKLGFGTVAKFIVQGDMGLLSVGTPELIAGAVTGAKIASATITGDKFAALNLCIERELMIVKSGAQGILATATAIGIEEFLSTTATCAYLTTNVNTPDGTDGTAAGVIATGWQALWFIYNPTTLDTALVSTSVLTSTGPDISGPNFSGYTKKRHVGFFYYSTIVEDFRQIGREFFHLKAAEASSTAALLAGVGSFVSVALHAATVPAIRLATKISVLMSTGSPVGDSSMTLLAKPTGSAMAADYIAMCSGKSNTEGIYTAGRAVVLQDASRAVDFKVTQNGWNSPTLTMTAIGFTVPQL